MRCSTCAGNGRLLCTDSVHMFTVLLCPSDLLINNCRILAVDLSDPEATRGATSKAKELFGKIDILVNNAGKSLLTEDLFLV